jgi:hypothetical protein
MGAFKIGAAYVVFSKVPFANLGLWKHSFAKATKLWVKLHYLFPVKEPKRWLRGAANVSTVSKYITITDRL